MRSRSLRLASLAAFLCAACSVPPGDEPAAEQAAGYAGSNACRDCHSPQFDAWAGSHHQLAMQVANEDTVLGDFSDVTFEYPGGSTRFTRKEGAFVVRATSARGEREDLRVTHTFGIEPLQQYLVEFRGGRRQALPVAWDTRPAAEGGQRWFHVYPGEWSDGEPLHWSDRQLNWNYMCAECHSTGVEPGYDMESDSFATAWSEIPVGCEGCHGPGSRHIERARAGRLAEGHGFEAELDDNGDSRWIMNADTGMAERSAPAGPLRQPEACGRCHSRRSVLAPGYRHGKPLADTHMPALLEDGLYFADGRIRDEVYVYGSFLQSRMYRAGVTCSDCHEPHSAGLVTGGDANDVCGQCHLPSKFATEEHGTPAAGDCVSCHMPARTYMGVDERRDHSFRVPGAGEQAGHYGRAIAAGRAGPANETILAALADGDHPAIARATLLTLLRPAGSEAERRTVSRALDDPDPLVRIGALRYLREAPPELRMEKGSHLLRDPVRGVRVEAALAYADLRDLLPVEDARAFLPAADEYRGSLRAGASLPESATLLAAFESRLGDDAAARAYLRHALQLDPDFAAARYAHGLLLVRAGQAGDALAELRRAHELEPGNGRYAYALGVALNSLGHPAAALEHLAAAHAAFPDDFDIGWALATMLRDADRREEARQVATDLSARFPDDDRPRGLLDALSANP